MKPIFRFLGFTLFLGLAAFSVICAEAFVEIHKPVLASCCIIGGFSWTYNAWKIIA